MNFEPLAVELDHFQMERDGCALFPQPITARITSGVLSILTGPNGSGKTSLLDIIALRSPLRDVSMIRWTAQLQPTDIAYLPQELWDVLDIRIRDLSILAGCGPAPPPGAPECLSAALAIPKKELGALSGGQRQLLLFWLVSSQPKRIFIYDEPLRHLDNVAAGYVVSMIQKQAEQGMLVILSEHSASTRWTLACHRIRLATQAAAI